MKRVLLVVLAVFVLAVVVGVVYLVARYPAQQPVVTTSVSEAPVPTAPIATYSAEELAKHASTESCWLVIKGNVYDVTSFISKHPGGEKKITSNCGREVTSIFTSIHSNRAWDLLGSFLIGTYQSPK